jgi:hypothetical protein
MLVGVALCAGVHGGVGRPFTSLPDLVQLHGCGCMCAIAP